MSAKQRPGCKPLFPVIISDDIIVTAGGGEIPSFEDLADATASRNGLSRGTERVILHAIAVKEDIVTDEEKIVENVEGETGCMSVGVEGLDASIHKALIEGGIEGEGAADLVDRVVAVDLYFCSEVLPVEIGGAKEVVVSE